MTDWTPEKPTTPGLYHWCDGVTEEVTVASVTESYRSWFVSFTGHLPVHMERVGGYWRPVPTPAPYIKPVPPKVSFEVWEGETLEAGYRLLHVYEGGDCMAFGSDGKFKCFGHRSHYTNLRRVDG